MATILKHFYQGLKILIIYQYSFLKYIFFGAKILISKLVFIFSESGGLACKANRATTKKDTRGLSRPGTNISQPRYYVRIASEFPKQTARAVARVKSICGVTNAVLSKNETHALVMSQVRMRID